MPLPFSIQNLIVDEGYWKGPKFFQLCKHLFIQTKNLGFNPPCLGLALSVAYFESIHSASLLLMFQQPKSAIFVIYLTLKKYLCWVHILFSGKRNKINYNLMNHDNLSLWRKKGKRSFTGFSPRTIGSRVKRLLIVDSLY